MIILKHVFHTIASSIDNPHRQIECSIPSFGWKKYVLYSLKLLHQLLHFFPVFSLVLRTILWSFPIKNWLINDTSVTNLFTFVVVKIYAIFSASLAIPLLFNVFYSIMRLLCLTMTFCILDHLIEDHHFDWILFTSFFFH